VTLCRAVVERPAAADRLAALFRPDSALAGPADSPLRGTFASTESMVAYARQHLEFWAEPTPVVDAPVLFVIGGQDHLVHPRAVRLAAAEFPAGRCLELTDAGHFAVETHADHVAGLVQGFTLACEAAGH
jgi:pimeloyl-ACP methyl ester carboxylesterase